MSEASDVSKAIYAAFEAAVPDIVFGETEETELDRFDFGPSKMTRQAEDFERALQAQLVSRGWAPPSDAQ